MGFELGLRLGLQHVIKINTILLSLIVLRVSKTLAFTLTLKHLFEIRIINVHNHGS